MKESNAKTVELPMNTAGEPNLD